MNRACSGRLCNKCGKCCDWVYSSYDKGDSQWIRNWKNWNLEDWKRWENHRLWNNFERRDNAQCRYSAVDPHCHYTGLIYRDIGCATCLCDTTFEAKWRNDTGAFSTRINVYSNY
ncbi:unnamed protein product [Rotaria socialis]|uniref:Uncharacterized protein n=1 Tax=Rotaria socialis TaxID=392032 RepID=A0A818J5N7_9BILA|nr:unnamed protein product [Rotaria socialis]CAF3355446.1 unnamed protein product [Rotaria socialis]CAF3456405.1 unnamed protein product [Rotaria socialis]CAF3526231.1 unnamed protein product [Rotaria socialis]CAF3530947.1 unnamed protein product [Rotaria socialis]